MLIFRHIRMFCALTLAGANKPQILFQHSLWNVYDSDERPAVGWHNAFQRSVGQCHVNIWTFISCLQKEHSTMYNVYYSINFWYCYLNINISELYCIQYFLTSFYHWVHHGNWVILWWFPLLSKFILLFSNLRSFLNLRVPIYTCMKFQAWL